MNKEFFIIHRLSLRLIFIILFFFSFKIKDSQTQTYINSIQPYTIGFNDSKPNTHLKRSLKILSWNIYMLPYIGSLKNNSTRAENIGEILSYLDYDIIVFEEAFYSKSRKLIINELAVLYPFMYGPVNPEKEFLETNSGIWILSKVSLKIIKSIRFKESKGFDAIAKKGAILLEGILGGISFQLIGTHLQANEYNNIRKKQMDQILKELINPYKEKDTPQIICGDFNVNAADSNEYLYMINHLNVKNDRLFSLNNVSFDELNNQLAITNKPIPKTLDYIFVGNNNKNVYIERCIKKFKGYNSEGKQIDLSDHYAIEANITLF